MYSLSKTYRTSVKIVILTLTLAFSLSGKALCLSPPTRFASQDSSEMEKEAGSNTRNDASVRAEYAYGSEYDEHADIVAGYLEDNRGDETETPLIPNSIEVLSGTLLSFPGMRSLPPQARPYDGYVRLITNSVLNGAARKLPEYLIGTKDAAIPSILFSRIVMPPDKRMDTENGFRVVVKSHLVNVGVLLREPTTGQEFILGEIGLVEMPVDNVGHSRELESIILSQFFPRELAQFYEHVHGKGIVPAAVFQEINNEAIEAESIEETRELFDECLGLQVLHECAEIVWYSLPESFKEEWKRIYPLMGNRDRSYVRFRNLMRFYAEQDQGSAEEFFARETFADKMGLYWDGPDSVGRVVFKARITDQENVFFRNVEALLKKRKQLDGTPFSVRDAEYAEIAGMQLEENRGRDRTGPPFLSEDGSKLYLSAGYTPWQGNAERESPMLWFNRLNYRLRGVSLFGTVVSGDNSTARADAAEFISALDKLRIEGRLPENVVVEEWGIGNGRYAADFLDAVRESLYYGRLTYILCDISQLILDAAKEKDYLLRHKAVTEFRQTDISGMSHRDGIFLIRHNELLDDLPTQEIEYDNGVFYEVSVRPYISSEKKFIMKDGSVAIDAGEMASMLAAEDLEGLAKLDPVFLEHVKFEKTRVRISNVMSISYGKHIKDLAEKSGRSKINFIVNTGAIDAVIRGVHGLLPGGYTRFYDYAVGSIGELAELDENGRSGILNINGTVTAYINLMILKAAAKERGLDIEIGTHFAHLGAMLGEESLSVSSVNYAGVVLSSMISQLPYAYSTKILGVKGLENVTSRLHQLWRAEFKERCLISRGDFERSVMFRKLVKAGFSPEQIKSAFYEPVVIPGYYTVKITRPKRDETVSEFKGTAELLYVARSVGKFFSQCRRMCSAGLSEAGLNDSLDAFNARVRKDMPKLDGARYKLVSVAWADMGRKISLSIHDKEPPGSQFTLMCSHSETPVTGRSGAVVIDLDGGDGFLVLERKILKDTNDRLSIDTGEITGKLWDNIIRAAETAKQKGESIILGLEDGWIPRSGAAGAVYAAMLEELKDLPKIMERLGYDNVIFFSADGNTLADRIETARVATRTSFSNIIVLCDKDLMTPKPGRIMPFERLQGHDNEDKAMVIGIERPEGVEGIDLFEMYMLAMSLNMGKDASSLDQSFIKISTVPDAVRVFIFTPVKPVDIEGFNTIIRLRIKEIERKA